MEKSQVSVPELRFSGLWSGTGQPFYSGIGEYDLGIKAREGENIIAVEVSGYIANSFYLLKESLKRHFQMYGYNIREEELKGMERKPKRSPEWNSDLKQ